MSIGVSMREAILALLLAVVIAFIVFTCVDKVNAAETTTLETVIHRNDSTELIRQYDPETGVVCYWYRTHPAHLDCVQVHPIGHNQHKRLKNGD